VREVAEVSTASPLGSQVLVERADGEPCEHRDVSRGDGGGVRDEYAAHPGGATGWYREHGADYRNPHEPAVVALIEHAAAVGWIDPEWSYLDLACGSGEATLALVGIGADPSRIAACDPFTGAAYASRVGRAPHSWSFRDIALGACATAGDEGAPLTVDAVVCSFALHLCEASWLPLVCQALATSAHTLVILTPHKRPELRPAQSGWHLTATHRHPSPRALLRVFRAVDGSRA
jgi:hypothetical protein